MDSRWLQNSWQQMKALLEYDSKTRVMATDEKTLKALERIASSLTQLGVKSEDLKTLNRHIAQQRKEIAWTENGRLYPQKRSKARR